MLNEMGENNKTKTNRKSYSALQKGLIIGPLVGVFLGFFIPFLLTGELPFTESHDMLLGDMKGLVAIFYLHAIIGGAILGFVVGVIIGSIVDYMNK
jgi:F0F1-type ATP synthase assembly protein I